MAKEKEDNKILWIAGTAAVTAFVVWYVNRELSDREALRRMKVLQELSAGQG